MADLPATAVPPDRRERFRSFMRRFNPTASPKLAIDEDLIWTDESRSVYKKLAATAELRTGSQQLLIGGIGSGKTTELLLASQALRNDPRTHVFFVDVSAHTDLAAVGTGALLACLGREAVGLLQDKSGEDKQLAHAVSQIRDSAEGYWISYGEWAAEEASGFDDAIRVPGKLKPRSLDWDVQSLACSVKTVVASVRAAGHELAVVFDGLDRLLDLDKFWAMVEQDLRAIRPMAVSVILAGPLSVAYGKGRQVSDYFDETHHLPPAATDPAKSDFLLQVLRQRGGDQLFDDSLMERISRASGGVLRDLISLASSAGENAYLDNVDHIQGHHVDDAIDRLGNTYLLGLEEKHLEVLRTLLQGNGFSPSTPENMELLLTRRVLEYGPRYEVHPALRKALQSG